MFVQAKHKWFWYICIYVLKFIDVCSTYYKQELSLPCNKDMFWSGFINNILFKSLYECLKCWYEMEMSMLGQLAQVVAKFESRCYNMYLTS